MADLQRDYVPAKTVPSDYPLIDSDPHIKRVIRYARPSDYARGAAFSLVPPALMLTWEKFAPSYVGRGGFAPIMRLTAAIGLAGGFLHVYQLSCQSFYGWRENKREIEMDMREIVDKVKRGESPYGESSLSPHLQGVASRNSRYSSVFIHAMPWFNFVNHQQHGVDTAKYYQQAERELEEERNKGA